MLGVFGGVREKKKKKKKDQVVRWVEGGKLPILELAFGVGI